MDMPGTAPASVGGDDSAVTFRSPLYVSAVAVFWLTAAAICLMAARDVGGVLGWGLAAGCVALSLRALFLRIVVRADSVAVHGWFRARYVLLDDVVDVRAHAYDGLWVRGSPSKQIAMVGATTSTGSTIDAKGVLGLWRSGRIQRIAALVASSAVQRPRR